MVRACLRLEMIRRKEREPDDVAISIVGGQSFDRFACYQARVQHNQPSDTD